MTQARRPTALISYSHDSPEHEAAVLALCNRLRARGIDTFVDQFLPGAPSEGWPLWMERQIEARDFTLMVCTESYRRRFMETEASGIGLGVVWEARILRNLLYEDPERHGRIIPVLLQPGAREFVPTVFRGHFYDLSDDRGFESLLRHLLREPGAAAGGLGPLGPQGARWSAFERPWLVPDAMRTRYFTGRERLLGLLRSQLLERHRAALSGLGGVGKTQAAIEYAVRHRADYADGVFWVNAETVAGLTSGFVEIAQTLRLAAAADSDQERIVAAVLQWLNSTGRWLLILDNVESRQEVRPFVPAGDKGHVLITSRESVFQEFGIARALELVDLDDDEAARFLLTRTGRDDAEADDRAAAAELASELGNLPLALEQAGAYITETNAAFSAYLSAFRKRRLALMEKSVGLVSHDTVAVTWVANFEAVERESLAAAEVLRTSAFLAADAIPFELFLDGAEALGGPIAQALADPDDLAMADVLRPLARYSLIRSDPKSRAFSVHRLVQEVARASLAEPERKTYVERAIGALDAVFPKVEYANRVQCERLVPHVASIAAWMDSSVGRPEASGRVLDGLGEYLHERGRYYEAQPLMERALAIREKALGPDHPDVGQSLNSLATLHCNVGRYAEAQPLYERALAIREKALGPDHFDVAMSLNDIAVLHHWRGHYAEAQALWVRSLPILEKSLGPDHPTVATCLNNLGVLYGQQGSYAEARQVQERALEIQQKALGQDHPAVAISLNNLAVVHRAQGRYAQAQPLAERAFAILEKSLGPDHPNVATSLNNLAKLHLEQGCYAEAQPVVERALSIYEKALGPDHPNVARSLRNLAELYGRQGRHDEARPLAERALATFQEALGSHHPDVARSLSILAELDRQQSRPDEAELHYERALAIFEQAPRLDQPELAQTLAGLAALREKQSRVAEAVALYERALAIAQQAFDDDHPRVTEIRCALDALGTVR